MGAPVVARPLELQNLPIGLFGSAMSVAGLSVCWRLAHVRYGIPDLVALAFGGVAAFAFAFTAVGYAAKMVSHFSAVRAEFLHPVDGHLFGTVLIGLLQLPITVVLVDRRAALAIWMVGAIGMVFFVWLTFTWRIADRQPIEDGAPSLMIPMVGLLTVPLALPALGIQHLRGLMVACLAVGLFFSGAIFTIIFSRLLFRPPLPRSLQPSRLILVTPFSVGYSTYSITVGGTDLFAECLFVLSLFILAALLAQLRHLRRACPFRIGWWSVSFPLAASSAAALRFDLVRPDPIADTIAWGLLCLATVVAGALLIGSLAILRNGLLPENLEDQSRAQAIADANGKARPIAASHS